MFPFVDPVAEQTELVLAGSRDATPVVPADPAIRRCMVRADFPMHRLQTAAIV
jgi:hypothetical protein